MARDRRDIVDMPRSENEPRKARIQKLETRLTRQRQAFRALDRMDEVMLAMRFSLDAGRRICGLRALALRACDSGNGSLIPVDEDTNVPVFAEVYGDSGEQLLNYRIDIDSGGSDMWLKPGKQCW